MDPDATLQTMRASDSTREERLQAACDLNNWLVSGGYVPLPWSRDALKLECKKWMV